jgi:hypothetical protein
VHKRVLGLAVAVILGVVLVSASGAATTQTQKVTTINVSTRAAVIHYLRSVHMSAKHVVIQRGLRNYAGAHCPGKGWTCAGTRHTVVQIAKPGGQNRFACRTAKCAVVQLGSATPALRLHAAPKPPPPPPPGNTATCFKTTGTSSSCTINQPNSTGANTAIVWMAPPMFTGFPETLNFSVSITQGPTSAGISDNNNLACVRQVISVDGSTTSTGTSPITVTDNVHQLVFIQQNSLRGTNTVEGAVPSGKSFVCDTSPTSTLRQDQTETSVVNSKGSITQNQNTLPSTTSCDPYDAGVSGCANVVTDIEQNQDRNGFSGFKGHASGVNSARFEQSTTQVAIANTPSGTVTQQQNANVPNPPYSGIVGTISQDSSARSSAVVNQDETQCEDAVNVSTPIAAPTSPTSPPQCPVLSGSNDVPPPAGVTLNQTQWGPVLGPSAKSAGRVHSYHKGYAKSEQTGAGSGITDSFTLVQHSHQSADQISGQHNTMQGDCASSGNGSATGGTCDASQTVTVNGQDTSDGYQAGSISQLVIKCLTGDSCAPTPPPTPTITAEPSVNLNGETNATSATFEFTDPARNATFNCTLDTNTVTPCGNPSVISGLLHGTKTYSGLGFGPHTFSVTASDSSGNESNVPPLATFTWTVVPPDPTITASSKPTNPDFFGTSDTFAFTDTADPNVHYKCKLDGGTATACNGGSVTYTSAALAPGSHTFSVRAFDTTDTYGSLNSATYTWTILPLSVSALGGDGSSAGWACTPGGPIALTVGTTPYDPDTDIGTFAEIDLVDVAGTDLSNLVEPTFTSDNYGAGSPRYYIKLDNGDSLWGYPPAEISPTATDFGWAINNGNSYDPWSDVVSAESGAKVTRAIVIADGSQAAGQTDNISSLKFDTIDFEAAPSTCPSP